MIQLQPWTQLKKIFGFGAGAAQGTIGPVSVKDVEKSVYVYGQDPISSWYRDQMKLQADRFQLYKEFEDLDSSDVICCALDLYAEDATQVDITTGRTIWVEAENENVETILNNMFDRIGANGLAFPIAREIAKFGDSFSGIINEAKTDGTPGRIVQIVPSPVFFTSRVEDAHGRLSGFTVSPIEQMGSQTSSGAVETSDEAETVATDPPWSFVHWRALGRNRQAIHGSSFLASARIPFRRLLMCMTGDTRISLLDGREERMDDLFKQYGKDQWFDVYSYDVDAQKVVAGRARHAGVTRKNAQLVAVTLDNGERVRCTPDHRWMLRDGSYKEAQALVPGESLMPLYRERDDLGYEKIRNPFTCTLLMQDIHTHRRMVSGVRAASDEVVHHIDLDKNNNSPDNLVWMPKAEHLKFHHELTALVKDDPEYHAKKVAAGKKRWAVPGRREAASAALRTSWQDPETRKNRIAGLHRAAPQNRAHAYVNWADPGYRAKVTVAQRDHANKCWEGNSARREQYSIMMKAREAQPERRAAASDRAKAQWADPQRRARILQGRATATNHKVASVEWLEQREDTYDIVVEGTHNFALTAGVFVHNSEDSLVQYRLKRCPDRFAFGIKGLSGMAPEDRFKVMNHLRTQLRKKQQIEPQTGNIKQELNPVTPDEDLIFDSEAVTIEHFSGSAQINPVHDIEYLRKRLCGALKIPPDYLGFTDASKGGTLGDNPLSMLDINFARMEKRLQRSIMEGFSILCMLELAWSGIDPTAVDSKFTVHMNPVSALDERQRLELEKVRIDTIENLQRIGKDLGIDSDEWQAYLLKRSMIPLHLMRTSGKEPTKIIKGKMDVMTEAVTQRVEEALLQHDEHSKLFESALSKAKAVFKTARWPNSYAPDDGLAFTIELALAEAKKPGGASVAPLTEVVKPTPTLMSLVVERIKKKEEEQ